MGKAELFSISGRKAPMTPLEALRSLLDSLEQGVGDLSRSDAPTALQLPAGFDQAAALLTTLRERGANVTAEQTRFDTVAAQYRRKAALFLKRIGGARVLAARRQEVQPDADAWWWTLDLWLAARRREARRRSLRWAAIAVVLLAALGFVYARFFAPDPTAKAVYRAQLQATDLAAAGDYAGALEQTERALALDPANPELLTLKGVLLSALGDPLAEETFAAAEATCSSREAYLTLRGQLEVQTGRWEAARQTAEALLEVAPRSAVAHLYRGIAAEASGDFPQARADYERAGELAQEQGLHEVYVTSRNLLANVLMRTTP